MKTGTIFFAEGNRPYKQLKDRSLYNAFISHCATISLFVKIRSKHEIILLLVLIANV